MVSRMTPEFLGNVLRDMSLLPVLPFSRYIALVNFARPGPSMYQPCGHYNDAYEGTIMESTVAFHGPIIALHVTRLRSLQGAEAA